MSESVPDSSQIASGHRPLHTLVDTPDLRMRFAPGTGDILVVSFASIGRKRAEMPPDEFLGTILGDPARNALFVSDQTRSWLNNEVLCDTLQTTLRSVREEFGIAKVITIGVSLGAFSALAASALFPVDAAIAISPQFSMMPEHIPGEQRWRYWRKQITTFRFETAEVVPAPRQSYAFHGLEDDVPHMQAFAPRRGLDQFAFAGQSHSSLGRHLRDAGVLPDMLEAAIAEDRRRMAQLAKRSGGLWRSAAEKQLQS